MRSLRPVCFTHVTVKSTLPATQTSPPATFPTPCPQLRSTHLQTLSEMCLLGSRGSGVRGVLPMLSARQAHAVVRMRTGEYLPFSAVSEGRCLRTSNVSFSIPTGCCPKIAETCSGKGCWEPGAVCCGALACRPGSVCKVSATGANVCCRSATDLACDGYCTCLLT